MHHLLDSPSMILSVKLTRGQHIDELKSVCTFIGDYGISSNYFATLCEMQTDCGSSESSSVIVAFPVIIFQLSVKMPIDCGSLESLLVM